MICGIDLAGLKTNPTGMCLINEHQQFYTVYTDEDILSLIHQVTPSIVALDAPLSFHGEHFRDGDSELRKDYPVLPLTFRGMRSLTERAIVLASKIPCDIIEVYPHASKNVLNIASPPDLVPFGFSVLPSTPHELDAAAAALTGKYFLEGKYIKYGTRDVIIVPLH